jgi:hypothetical protein
MTCGRIQMRTRREFVVGLGAATIFAGALPIAGCKAIGESGEEVSANEDLMREHGVLRRALLVYALAAPKLRILTAIATTKIPELFHPNQGFWFTVSDARTDFAMTMSSLFLIGVGGGAWSIDFRIWGEGPVI